MSVSEFNNTANKTQRAVVRVVQAQLCRDGAGVTINRSIGNAELPDLDPFLLLDEIKSDDAADYIGGFPAHPHRGFETVTYMLAGKMRHRDSCGNEGVIGADGIQWMTAGRGILHSEMPEQIEGRLWGFQVWVNLPAAQKMKAPRYQEFPGSDIPEVNVSESGKIRVLAGNVSVDCVKSEGFQGGSSNKGGVVHDIATQPLMLDLRLGKSDRVECDMTPEHTALVYVYSGSLTIGSIIVKEGQLAILSDGDTLDVSTVEASAGALVLAAQPIKETIERYGPFVMNTRTELAQAFEDYQQGRFGQM